MKRDYLPFNSDILDFWLPKKRMVVLAIFFLTTMVYSQSTLTIVTTSNSPNWQVAVGNPSIFMDWTATGAVTDTRPNTNTPVFDFSGNGGGGDIFVETTNTPLIFNSITSLTADAGFGQQITSVDLTDLNNLEELFLADNLLTGIDLSQNTQLVEVELQRNDLLVLDVSQNTNLEILNVDANLNLTNLDISNNPNLEELSARDIGITTLDISQTPLLTDIDLTNAPLTSATIDDILNTLDGFGLSNGDLRLRNTTGGVITRNGIAAYISLLSKGWSIEPPQGFELGDAPSSYGTELTLGGAVHLYDPSRDEFILGNAKDAEGDGFPSVDADGDDNNNFNDEDAVDPNEFLGISTSTTNVDIDITATNNFNGPVFIHAWIDFDGSGGFDTDEYSTLTIPANAGQSTYTLNWDITALGADIQTGQTYARFRLTSDNDLTAASFGGFATGGEVEDYTLIIDLDTDLDGVPDDTDVDDDNDGILDTVEDNGVVDRDTDGDGTPDRIDLDSDNDTCFDVTEAGFTDVNGNGELGDIPVTVDANGQVTSGTDGYTAPNDLDANGTPDFQEAGVGATITTEPTDQDLIIGVSTFSVVATADTYQWEETQDGGTTWVPLVDGGDYAGTTTPDLQVTNSDVTKLTYRYRVIVSNIAFACDPTVTSVDVGYIIPDDFDLDGVFDIVDVDDDNDGILDVDEDNGVVDRDTDGDGNPDRIDLDADGDTCFDVTEAGFTDVNGDGFLGDTPVAVDANGQVTSGTDGYTPPNDLDANGTPDFQEAGVGATITTEPTDQDLIIGVSTFSVVAAADTYQWEETQDGGTTWVPLVDGGDYAGTTTPDLQVTNSDVTKITYRYRVIVNNIAFACDPTVISVDVGYITPDDFDLDGVFDIVDVDDDNDGILDTVEEDGDVNRDTDGDGFVDRIDLDADGDNCFDVTEAGFTDVNGDGFLGDLPVLVDANGQVTTGLDGYTPPNDLNGNGTPDFQEAGAAASITSQPTDQIFVLAGSSTFSVVTDAVAGDAAYQWEESTDNGVTWVPLADGGDYAGTTTADLVVSTPDFTKVFNRYRVIVSNVAFACDVTTISSEATFVTPGDFDRDGVFDVVDVDDDNDGILDVDEDNGVVDRDTDGDGNPDRIQLDADSDGCFDVIEAGFTDVNGDGFLGDFPVVVDANGQVTSGTDGYTPPNDLDGNGTPDFQEAGAAATITTQPVNQALVIGVNTFSVVATADTYQWEESQDGGTTWTALADGGDYAGATTADLSITNSDISKATYQYRVVVNNIAYACDPVTTSAEVGFSALNDFDGDGVVDIVDVDDDNDGILDSVEDNGVVDRDTDGDGTPDRIQLDADNDGCFDVTEAGFTDDNGDGQLGDAPVTVDASGQVTSGSDGYTAPNDLDGNGTPDFQEAGAAATITTQPVDQEFLPGNSVTFSVVATADTFQWEESQDGGTTWNPLTDGGNYAGTTTPDLTVSNLDVSVLSYQYRILVNNIAYACDPVTISDVVGFVLLDDTDNDGVPDLVDVDDDNDGILDTVEDNGVVDRDTDGDGTPDRIQLDSDSDGCFDVTEAGFTDGDGDGELGSAPVTVDANGQVTSGTDGYTTPNDLDNNGTPDFQEAGSGATISTQPVDQDFVLNGSATFTVDSDGAGYQWQISTDGVNWTDLSDDATYSGTTTNSLTVSNLLIPNYFDFYRAVATNVAYACDPGDISDTVTYNTLADTDNDGVFDIVDIDDDNDGIYDSVEGENTDSNNDGVPDRISLDADGDGCDDVVEALRDITDPGSNPDPDGDGILGTSPVSVDADGQVVGQGGYTTPNDNNNNGTFDFQEAGSPSSISNQPTDVTVSLGQDAVFEVSGSASVFQWQESTDGGANWMDLMSNDQYIGVNTDRLTIVGARGRLEGNRYRVVLTSYDFACDPNPELNSDAVRLIFDTGIIPSGFSPNGDGSNDLFLVPGLIETPDFKMEVFDRWGNSVYKYNNNGSSNPVWWDGRSTGNMTLSKGELVPAGTYFYLIEFNDGNTKPAKGWVYVNY